MYDAAISCIRTVAATTKVVNFKQITTYEKD